VWGEFRDGLLNACFVTGTLGIESVVPKIRLEGSKTFRACARLPSAAVSRRFCDHTLGSEESRQAEPDWPGCARRAAG